MSNKPKIIRAIFSSLIAFLIFFISYLLIYLVAGGIINLLLNIPVIKWLVVSLFRSRGDTPAMMLAVLCPFISAPIASGLARILVGKHEATHGLSVIITGVLLLIIFSASFIENLLYKDFAVVYQNVFQIISSIWLIAEGTKTLRSSS